MKSLGWVLSNNEKGDMVIQKDDESNRFKNDDEATEFVVKSYLEMVDALKMAIEYMENDIEYLKTWTQIREAIKSAEGGK